jgi:PIN domain nuclease of toxin-antitoxin system
LRLLLDSHVLLWWLAGDRLEARAQRAIASGSSVVFVSAASVWEIELKKGRGKVRTEADLAHEALLAGFLELPVGFEHARAAGRLPAHHRDPFDRVLVAQAQVEGLVLVTRDRTLRRYDVPILAA